MTTETFPASTANPIPSTPEGRFDGIRRPYTAEDVNRLRGSVQIQHTLAERGMGAYSELQVAEFAADAEGYTATRHQREVGTGYFDQVSVVITGGKSSTTAMAESTETAQFQNSAKLQAAE